jgi:hypothetical protein
MPWRPAGRTGDNASNRGHAKFDHGYSPENKNSFTTKADDRKQHEPQENICLAPFRQRAIALRRNK